MAMDKEKRLEIEKFSVVLMRACLGIAKNFGARSVPVTVGELFTDFLAFGVSACRVSAGKPGHEGKAAWNKAFRAALRKYDREVMSGKRR
jgi:hypothetical protein